MSVTAHLEELRRKHAVLSQKVEEEERHLAADDLEVRALKREKLKLKEEISRLGHYA
ncbi:MAG: DUF465 domain-containing protein [Pseudomonadota bacterium]